MKTKLGKRKCNWCKVEFQKTRPIDPACSYDCLINLAKAKVKKDRKVLEKAELKEMKDSLPTHAQWLNALQRPINHIARLIDSDFPCISSNRTSGKWNGGHYYTVGAHPNIRFHLFNIYKQSFKDNHFNSANITEYTYNLYRLFGNDFVNEEILKLDQKYPVTKLSIPETKEKIAICRKIISRQKKGEFIAKTIGERITIRIELNQLIGIYK
jgi:hypothetical protein